MSSVSETGAKMSLKDSSEPEQRNPCTHFVSHRAVHRGAHNRQIAAHAAIVQSLGGDIAAQIKNGLGNARPFISGAGHGTARVAAKKIASRSGAASIDISRDGASQHRRIFTTHKTGGSS
jgi:hypothetical protein